MKVYALASVVILTVSLLGLMHPSVLMLFLAQSLRIGLFIFGVWLLQCRRDFGKNAIRAYLTASTTLVITAWPDYGFPASWFREMYEWMHGPWGGAICYTLVTFCLSVDPCQVSTSRCCLPVSPPPSILPQHQTLSQRAKILFDHNLGCHRPGFAGNAGALGQLPGWTSSFRDDVLRHIHHLGQMAS